MSKYKYNIVIILKSKSFIATSAVDQCSDIYINSCFIVYLCMDSLLSW